MKYLYNKKLKTNKNFIDNFLIEAGRSYRDLKHNIILPQLYSLNIGSKNLVSGFVSFQDLFLWSEDWVKSLPQDIDLIIGIPRSGLLVANILSLKMGLPLTTTEFFISKQYWQSRNVRLLKKIKKALLVDDSLNTGITLSQNYFLLKKYFPDIEFMKASLIISEDTQDKIDYYYKIIPQPKIFEWDMLHVKYGKFGSDIDGVLCEDCPEDIDDNEDLYSNWIENAKPKLIPTITIDVIISNRLEKYRKITERWLNKNKVRFRHLILWDTRKEDRVGQFSKHKIENIKKHKINIFWESSFTQANEIYRQTGVATLCLDKKILFKK